MEWFRVTSKPTTPTIPPRKQEEMLKKQMQEQAEKAKQEKQQQEQAEKAKQEKQQQERKDSAYDRLLIQGSSVSLPPVISLSEKSHKENIFNSDDHTKERSPLIMFHPTCADSFSRIKRLIPDTMENNFSIQTFSQETNHSFSAEHIQTMLAIFKQNPLITTIFATMHSPQETFSINKTLLDALIQLCFTLNQSTTQQQKNNAITEELSQEYMLHNHITAKIQKINYYQKSFTTDINVHDELVITDEEAFLKTYNQQTPIIRLVTQPGDIGVIRHLHIDAKRANEIQSEPASFIIKTKNQEYFIKYITCDNNCQSLGEPIQTITKIKSADDKCMHSLSIDFNDIVTLQTQDGKSIPLQCTKEQFAIISATKQPFSIGLAGHSSYTIGKINYNNEITTLSLSETDENIQPAQNQELQQQTQSIERIKDTLQSQQKQRAEKEKKEREKSKETHRKFWASPEENQPPQTITPPAPATSSYQSLIINRISVTLSLAVVTALAYMYKEQMLHITHNFLEKYFTQYYPSLANILPSKVISEL